MALASIYLMKKQHDDAVAAAIKAMRLQPGDSFAHVWVGFYNHWAGRGEEAVAAIKIARQLNPKFIEGRDPSYLAFMGFAAFTAGFYEEAIEAMKLCISRFGPAVPRHPFLIASYILIDRREEARAAAQELLKMNPKFSLSSWRYGHNYKNPADVDRLYNALRKAGLP
jgi:adenylate cyclase